MKKYLTGVVLLLLLMTVTFNVAACGSKTEIRGVWNPEDTTLGVYEFKENGSGSYTISNLSPIQFYYTVKGGAVTIEKQIFGKEEKNVYPYKIESNKLILTIDGQDVMFEKAR